MRQKWEIYFHPRDKDGNIKIPEAERVLPEVEPAPTLEGELWQLAVLCAKLEESHFPMPPEERARLEAGLRAKFASQPLLASMTAIRPTPATFNGQ